MVKASDRLDPPGITQLLDLRRTDAGIDLVHFYDSATRERLCSKGRHFWYEDTGGRRRWSAAFPRVWRDIAATSRLARRLGRLDQVVLMPLNNGDVFACREGRGYVFEPHAQRITHLFNLRQCRVPLQVERTSDGGLIFGEYGANLARRSIPIWRCGVSGRDWRQVYEIPAGRARHVHGVFRDPFDDAYFIVTGDFAGENWLVRCDAQLRHCEYWGDGSQTWRAVTLFFQRDFICWITDSHLQRNYVTVCERRTRRVHTLAAAPSPCWYGKTLTDGILLAGCAWEHGPGCTATGATLLASDDGLTWTSVHTWKKDPWPAPWFKNGVVRFAAGPQTASDFMLAGEGLEKLDGVAQQAALVRA